MTHDVRPGTFTYYISSPKSKCLPILDGFYSPSTEPDLFYLNSFILIGDIKESSLPEFLSS